MPCLTDLFALRPRRPAALRAGRWSLALAGLLAQASLAAAPPDPARESLLQATRQWVAQNQARPPAEVQFAALDSRLKVQDCDRPLQMDYPFSSSKETVRVRCGSERPWQLYLRLVPATPAAPAGQAPQAAGPGLPPPPPVAPSTIAVATKPALVTRRLIQRGTVLGPDVVELVQRPALGLDPLTMSSLQDVEHGEAIRDIPAGTVLRSYDIKRSLMVKKGQTALMTLGLAQGLQVSVRVEAQQDGHIGEQIRLKNTESGRLLSGVVTGPNAVRGIQNP